MWIYKDLKLIYIRVPKTGSTSFTIAIGKKYRSRLAYQNCDGYQRQRTEEANKIAKQGVQVIPIAGENFRLTNNHGTAKVTKQIIDPDMWDSYQKIGFVRHPYDWIKSFYFFTGTKIPFKKFVHENTITPFFWLTDNDKLLVDKVYRTEDLAQLEEEFGVSFERKNSRHDVFTARYKELLLGRSDKAVIHERFKRELEYY